MKAIAWTEQERDLWSRIEGHEFEPEGCALTFAARLARDHRWSIEHARRAIQEYRRFCFLAVTSSGQMTPSEPVDEVWHQHLIFSRDYWDTWCRHVLCKPLHHQPTQGGTTEGARFSEQYARTLARYEAYFGAADPAYWPGTAKRFGQSPRFRIVDLDQAVIVPIPASLRRFARRAARMSGVASVIGLFAPGRAAAMPTNVLDWPAGPFLQLYIAVAIVALGAAFAFKYWMRLRGETHASPFKLSDIELALLAGGERRAADLLALEMLQAGQLKVGPDRTLLIDAGAKNIALPQMAGVISLGPNLARSSLPGLMRPWIRPAWDRLAQQGLALSFTDVARIRAVTIWLIVPVVVFGLAKITVGLSRAKPVEFLIVLVVLTAIGGTRIAQVGRLAARAGRVALSDYEQRHARALRAPLPEETITAFAIMGAAALAGTNLAAYAQASEGGSADGAGCGGGGGGGGCGGCGGD